MKIYNSLTKRKEEFVPIEDNHVRMYNCGPTVYDYFHIGNARNFITAEVIRRYMEYKGYRVTFVQNVTDIEDKIIKRAIDTGVKPSDVATKFTEEYFKDMEMLGIKPPTFSPKATEHIDDIINYVNSLVEKGIAYVVDGDVYYDLSKFKDYGKLSGQKIDEIISGARVEVDEKKRHPADFNLWKSAKPGEPAWDSPWGKGRPGWHIECSVMSSKYLGETFDIHSGGNDLIFPHHENEIAQSEALTGKPLARYWVHNGMLQITGGKMSKSLGNIKTIRELLKDYDANTIRLYLLSAHYRAPLELKDNSLDEASNAVARIYNCVKMTDRLGSKQKDIAFDKLTNSAKELDNKIDDTIQKFETAMDDDFNTPGALGAIFDLVSAINIFISENEPLCECDKTVIGRANLVLTELCGILGIDFKKSEFSKEGNLLIDSLLKLIIEIRNDARSKKDWATSDKIRNNLAELGIKLKDTRDGTIWEFE
ncbi:MAG: cysteine--tRNA ligase [bacterium]